MVKCVFCGKDKNLHKGVFLIKNDGSVNYLCSSKCRRNMINLGRDKRKVMWTQAYREEMHRVQQAEQRQQEKQAQAAAAKREEKPKASKKKAAAK